MVKLRLIGDVDMPDELWDLLEELGRRLMREARVCNFACVVPWFFEWIAERLQADPGLRDDLWRFLVEKCRERIRNPPKPRVALYTI